MRRIAIALFAFMALTTGAEAKHRHVAHHDHTYSEGRPADCYGIPWCGCWLRHQFGFDDKRLNRASLWANIGHAVAGPVEHAVGVMHHHVFLVLKVLGPHTVLAISGNDGHQVKTRVRSTAGTFAWRMVGSGDSVKAHNARLKAHRAVPVYTQWSNVAPTFDRFAAL